MYVKMYEKLEEYPMPMSNDDLRDRIDRIEDAKKCETMATNIKAKQGESDFFTTLISEHLYRERARQSVLDDGPISITTLLGLKMAMKSTCQIQMYLQRSTHIAPCFTKVESYTSLPSKLN